MNRIVRLWDAEVDLEYEQNSAGYCKVLSAKIGRQNVSDLLDAVVDFGPGRNPPGMIWKFLSSVVTNEIRDEEEAWEKQRAEARGDA